MFHSILLLWSNHKIKNALRFPVSVMFEFHVFFFGVHTVTIITPFFLFSSQQKWLSKKKPYEVIIEQQNAELFNYVVL